MRTPCLRLLLKTGDRHFTWSSESHYGLPVCGMQTAVPSFLSYFKTLSIVPALVIEPAASRFAVNPAEVRRTCSVSSVSGHISDCPGNVQLMLRLSQPRSLQDSLTSFFLEAREGTLFMKLGLQVCDASRICLKLND